MDSELVPRPRYLVAAAEAPSMFASLDISSSWMVSKPELKSAFQRSVGAATSTAIPARQHGIAGPLIPDDTQIPATSRHDHRRLPGPPAK